MTPPRGRVPPGRENAKLPRDRFVRIPRYQTAKLWIIPKRSDPTPHVVSVHCPTCRDPDNSRLLHVVLKTDGSELEPGASASRGKNPNVRILLHVTREQIEEIRESFGKHDIGDTLRDILDHKGDPDEDPDWGTVP